MADHGPGYSFDELVQLFLDAGGRHDQAVTAAAIASAESNGCRYALAGPADVRPVKACTYRHTDGENSYGLWQVNIAPGANPQYAGWDLFDPLTNARAAVAISLAGSDWTPWSTYNNGAYLAKLPGVDVATPASTAAGAQRPAGTRVTPRQGDLYTDNPEHLGGAWALLTRALAHDVPASRLRAVAAASKMRGAVR